MRYLKMVGLAVVAAAASTAVVGVATASALNTTLCTSIGCGTSYSSGTTIEMSLKSETSSSISGGGVGISECTSSSISGTTTATSASVIPVNISSITWGGCSATTDTVTNGTLEIGYTTAGNGTVWGRGNVFKFAINNANCTYTTGSPTHLGPLVGGTAPYISISVLLSTVEGPGTCPNAVLWNAEYEITTPHALYVLAV